MAWEYSERSKKHFQGVDRRLVALAYKVLEESEFDLMILDGRRTIEEQRQLVSTGASRTMRSKHIEGKALDVGVLVCGKLRWENDLYDYLGELYHDAALTLGVPVVWGAAWGRELGTYRNATEAKSTYVAECIAAGRRAFYDGPHIELHESAGLALPI